MRVRVNGEHRQLPAAATVGALLADLGVQREGVAVAVNTRVVPRGELDRVALQEGDSVEVIRAVGGG